MAPAAFLCIHQEHDLRRRRHDHDRRCGDRRQMQGHSPARDAATVLSRRIGIQLSHDGRACRYRAGAAQQVGALQRGPHCPCTIPQRTLAWRDHARGSCGLQACVPSVYSARSRRAARCFAQSSERARRGLWRLLSRADPSAAVLHARVESLTSTYPSRNERRWRCCLCLCIRP